MNSIIGKLEAGSGDDLPIDDLKLAVAHISDQRSVVGAQMNKADNQRQVL